jgi:RHS repeat-associated protein
LTATSDSSGWSRQFGYDAWGNMWVTANSGVNLAGNTPTANVYNSNNQIRGASYDAAGNLLLVNGFTLGYDAENRQISATEQPSLGSGQELYLYDGEGQRVEKVAPAGNTIYVYDAFGQLAAQYNTFGNSFACTTCYVMTDHLGSVRMVTDQNGAAITRHDYLPFGEEIPGSSPSTDMEQRFTGQIRDTETGMDFFNARYYTAPLGRFNSVDPISIGALLSDPQSWNGYAYVRNSPLTFVDASGRCFWDACVAEGYGTYLAIGAIATTAVYLGTPQGQQLLQNAGNALVVAFTSFAKTLQPGPYLGGSIPLRGPGRNFTQGERDAVNGIGKCHSCGATDPGTQSGNWVIDHQPPSALNKDDGGQRGYPQCIKCSRQQGGDVRAAQQAQSRAFVSTQGILGDLLNSSIPIVSSIITYGAVIPTPVTNSIITYGAVIPGTDIPSAGTAAPSLPDPGVSDPSTSDPGIPDGGGGAP